MHNIVIYSKGNQVQAHKICLVLIAVTFGGCANVANLVKERREAHEQAYISNAQESCKRYGFLEKSDAFAQCIQNDVNAAKARDAIEENAFHARNAASTSTTTSCTNTIVGMECTTH